jgi:hypothetical protein
VSALLPWLLSASLAGHVGAHLAIAVGLASTRAWARAALALLVPPLAPYWGWQLGMRRRVAVWAVSLALYALGVAIA